jgi:hypothetical protein
MNIPQSTDWQEEFGISGTGPRRFFASVGDLDAAGNSVAQAHVIRRAFDELQLAGVLCHDNNPVIYFRLMDRLDPIEIESLHRTFWNQGVAPILVLITADEVHIYSSLSQPKLAKETGGNPAGFVQKLDRVAEKLQSFLIAVESREYFREHRHAFDPKKRVDRDLLQKLKATREVLDEVTAARLATHTLDALLCRLVFTCYLFDREVIDRKYLELSGIMDAAHLRDILGRRKRSEAKTDLYRLFHQLGQDFNGDLFSDDLDAEARQVRVEHLNIVNDFFQGTDPKTGQRSFWPYEFGIIPIETISAIYEHFLKSAGEREKKESGAFYTPRSIAELVIDLTLNGVPNLLDKRFLDPACGSGIFLVGLFNRLADEWGRLNPKASYDAKLKGLTSILKTNIYGIDKNRTACLIAAFSLYLAFLDQLSPPDIRRVLKKVKVLPRLVSDGGSDRVTIRCADFFTEAADLPEKVDYVIGNPPWSPAKGSDPASAWIKTRRLPFPAKQLAVAFVWKAPEYLKVGGMVCFVLPHGLLFNHTITAIDFQKRWFMSNAVTVVLNLADYQRFLFEDSEAPALIIKYSAEKPSDSAHQIDYWSPKTDWAATQAELISILPQDRNRLTIREILDDLKSDDAPLIWKERYWATFRDRRLLDRLRLYPRLRDVTGKRSDTPQRWIIAEGFEPFGELDKEEKRSRIDLPYTAKVERATHDLNLFLLPADCHISPSLKLDLRVGISDLRIFQKPLVLVKRGFSTDPEVAFANFNIAYRNGIRGIHGPEDDSNLLAFLTFYLRSKLARYFLFHTSASWGVSRATVDIDDLMRLPFPLPDQTENPARAAEIVEEASEILADSMKEAGNSILGRGDIVTRAQSRVERLIEEYFDIDDIERFLVKDTEQVVIPSVRPARTRIAVPTILPATDTERHQYVTLLCETLNRWASKGFEVHGRAMADGKLGVGMAVLEKTKRGHAPSRLNTISKDFLLTLAHVQDIASADFGSLELTRGLKVFDGTLLYVTKPIGRRFWTQTSALNDADEIAGTLLMRQQKEHA